MEIFTFKRSSINNAMPILQVLLLFGYFALNIINVGEMGTALPLLAGFVVLAGLVLFADVMKDRLTVKVHFFVFILFVVWVSFRVIVDLQDLEYLKQVTIATTGGMLLFFLLGTFARESLNKILLLNKTSLAKTLLIIFSIVASFVFISFKGRLLEINDIFYISGVDGGYQRPGNFMVMLFLIASFLYLGIAACFKTKKLTRLIFWLVVYSAGMICILISSQMIGSNSATANILAIYLMTVVISLLAFSGLIRDKFLNNHLSHGLVLSKLRLRKMIKYSFVFALVGFFLAYIALQLSGFDLTKTRAFGFGTGDNSSVSSRMDILKETGTLQMGYSPILGNIDVARLTTGEAGRTLHNFIPNIIAELGLIGLIIVAVLFSMLIRSLILAMKKKSLERSMDYKNLILCSWFFFVFLFLFLYANFAVGYSWSVMWFFVGFAVSVFNRRNSSKGMRICAVS